MKVLFIGDIVGQPGRDAIRSLVPVLKKEYQLDFVIANAENAAGGSGITDKVAQDLFQAGVGALTSGDHIWKKREILDIIDREPRILRPLNYPANAPGRGWEIYGLPGAGKLAVVNVLGRVFMDPLECPFRTVMQAITEISKQTKLIVVDIHAEATSEKVALGWYLNGLVSAVVGTHTHIQTADEKILSGGTAYLTDAGMTGPCDSVIGRKIEDVLSRFITCMPTRFEIADSNVQLQGAVIEIDAATGKALSIQRLQRKV